MPSEVRHLVDGGQTYPVVRLTGVLDASTAPEVRSALLVVLAGQPEAVVVDVRELTPREPGEAAVLAEIARGAADWPGCRLALSVGDDGRAWQDVGLPSWPSPAEAITALGEPSPDHYRRVELEPVVGAARHSRELVAEACERWRLPELAGPACIVVTEMVNNVVAHVGTPMTVLLGLHGGTMSVAVRDQSPNAPHFTGSPVPVTSYGGRGLLLIDSVSRRWGSLVLADGKVVWAMLDSDPEVPGQLSGTGMTGQIRG